MSFNQMVDRPSYTGRSPSAISDYEYTVLAARTVFTMTGRQELYPLLCVWCGSAVSLGLGLYGTSVFFGSSYVMNGGGMLAVLRGSTDDMVIGWNSSGYTAWEVGAHIKHTSCEIARSRDRSVESSC